MNDEFTREKTKLGVSLNLFVALLYFFSAIGSWGILATIIATGYVLLFEENDKLKKIAIKTLIFIIFLTILTVLINLLTTWLIISIVPLHDFFSFPISIHTWQAMVQSIDIIIRVIIFLILIIHGFRAYKGRYIKIKWIDSILGIHFDTQ
jgi:hypothetical protein